MHCRPRYDTIEDFNVDSKAEHLALSSTRSRKNIKKKKLKQTVFNYGVALSACCYSGACLHISTFQRGDVRDGQLEGVSDLLGGRQPTADRQLDAGRHGPDDDRRRRRPTLSDRVERDARRWCGQLRQRQRRQSHWRRNVSMYGHQQSRRPVVRRQTTRLRYRTINSRLSSLWPRRIRRVPSYFCQSVSKMEIARAVSSTHTSSTSTSINVSSIRLQMLGQI